MEMFGREHDLMKLNSEFDSKDIFAIYGLRSVGKSRLVETFINKLSWKSIWIDMGNMKSMRPVYMTLLQRLLPHSVSAQRGVSDWLTGIERILNEGVSEPIVIVLDNAEDVIETEEIAKEFLQMCTLLTSTTRGIKVFVTSTTEMSFDENSTMSLFSFHLKPLDQESSTQLLLTNAPTVNFGSNMATIVELCEGLPLALLMTSSILGDEDSLFTAEEMVRLLRLCRMEVLSQAMYQRKERIDIVYGEFLRRLSMSLRNDLATLVYIPGSFTDSQASAMIGNTSNKDTYITTLQPVIRRNIIYHNSETDRYDVHGILRDCAAMYLELKNLSETRRRFCQIFARLIIGISEKVDSSEYLEGLCLYNLERQNFQKLLTDVMYTTEDTYGLYMELALRAANVIIKFMGDAGVQFYQELMTLCRNYKNIVDEACVRIQFGSMLTNVKGKTSLAEENYGIALNVLNEVSQSSPSERNGDDLVRRALALAYQRIGWNVGSQGRWQEALVYLDKAFHLEEELHMYYEELAISTVQSLSVFNTFLGNLDLGLKLNKEALRRRIAVYGTEEHPNVGSLVNNLGIIYRKLGQKDLCLECFRNGLSLKRKTKATAKSIAISLENVALAFSDQGDHDQAHHYLKEAYDLLDKTPNLYRDNRAYAYSIEGEVLQKQARHAEAISILKIAAKIMVREAPHEIYTSKLYFEIANSYFALENYPKAIVFYRKVFSLKQELLREVPTCDRLYQSCMTALYCHVKLGDEINRQKWYDEATSEATRLIQIFRSYGKDEKVSVITDELLKLKKRFESDVESY